MISNLYIGTSGWSYSNWKDMFYPREVKTANWLPYYATKFRCAEVNSSFYRIPLFKSCEKWCEMTPEDFRFCIKMYRGITQFRRLRNCEEMLDEYMYRISPLKPKLGPILIQLPPSLRFEADVADNFFRMLMAKYSDYSFALEGRHATWFSDESLTLLANYNIAHVIGDSYHYVNHEAITADTAYIRFHGRERLFYSNYEDDILQEYAVKVAGWLQEEMKVWIFFNNTAVGHAILNALQLQKMIETKMGK
jgi:uncharacterized protein YecE (DUF72 family)